MGVQEILVIFIILIVLFGGSKVTGMGKALGTSLREFKEEVNKDSASVSATAVKPDGAAQEQHPQDNI